MYFLQYRGKNKLKAATREMQLRWFFHELPLQTIITWLVLVLDVDVVIVVVVVVVVEVVVVVVVVLVEVEVKRSSKT